MMGRASGILMPISSLPGEYGIGSLGKKAYEFADFLKESGQRYWQILPIGHTGYGDSPYQAFSAFAGNPYFIDLELLEQDSLLTKADYIHRNFGQEETCIDYSQLFKEKLTVLRIAYNHAKELLRKELDGFKQENASWLEDYALFMAVKFKMELKSWQEWEQSIKLRELVALEYYSEMLEDEIGYWVFIQYEFFKQWQELKRYVNAQGIQFIGDMPIYVASDSADIWAKPEMFKLGEDRRPLVVAGCPPDAFSEEGQLWGNPIYDWDYLEQTQYNWWMQRIRESLKLYDIIRIDHFRGFESYWEVPSKEKTAKNGQWIKGPGIQLFNTIKEKLGEVQIIAEDLGYLTEEVRKLREQTGYPGMKVLQFAFDCSGKSDYLPHYYNKNCVVYTGTHDNDTIMGWIESTGDEEEVENAKKYFKLDITEGYHWGMIRGAWSSVADLAITQMQDLLGLGNETRMNYPSTLGENWRWRMREGAIDKKLMNKLYELTKMYGRLNENA